MYFSNILLSLAGAASVASAHSISCQDSGLCVGHNSTLSSVLGQLKGMDQHQRVTDGQHLACVETAKDGNSSLCLSYQKTGRSWTVFQTAWLVQSLMEHGCQACGTMSLGSEDGELTAGIITNARRGLDISEARRGMDMVRVVARTESR
ncbi:hypothetical protein ACHAQJ_010730 [Trichoderma viride]